MGSRFSTYTRDVKYIQNCRWWKKKLNGREHSDDNISMDMNYVYESMIDLTLESRKT
jgi:hypothetical protein